jgi:ketosteroid isomerase-like protein
MGTFGASRTFPTDIEIVVSPEVLDAGTYRGEAARQWLRAWVESFDPFRIEASEFIDAGDNIVVGVRMLGRMRGSAAEIEGHWWFVHTIAEGELARIRAFPDRRQALEAAGLSE